MTNSPEEREELARLLMQSFSVPRDQMRERGGWLSVAEFVIARGRAAAEKARADVLEEAAQVSIYYARHSGGDANVGARFEALSSPYPRPRQTASAGAGRMTRTSSWDKPENSPATDTERQKIGIAAAGVAFKAGANWRVAVRSAIAAVDEFDRRTLTQPPAQESGDG